MNNTILRKTNSAIFLAIVLVTGTFAVISPSSFIIEVNAQSERYYGMDSYDDRKSYGMDDSYGPTDYRMDNNYRKSYGNDYGYGSKQAQSYENNDYKSKDKDSSSNSISLSKLNCNNVNIIGNVNGNISIDNNGRGGGAVYPTEDKSASAYGNNGERYNEGYEKDKDFKCIITNNNTIITAANGNATNGNETDLNTTLSVTKIVTCTPNISQAAELCELVQSDNPPSSFNITVTGNNPNPSEFAGSNDPVVVNLDAGDYEVREIGPPLPAPPFGTISINRSFDGDCTAIAPGVGVATGTIETGESQTCFIINAYTATAPVGGAGLTASNINTATSASNINTAGGLVSSFSTPPTTAQEPEESSALAKITKLKTQWLNQLS